MKRKLSRFAVPLMLSLTVALYACGPAEAEPAAGSLVLWEDGPTGQGIAVTSSATGAVGARLPYGALDRVRSLLYAAVPATEGASTTVQVYALPRGGLVRSTNLAGDFMLADQSALSFDGRFLVLQERFAPQPGAGYEHQESTFAVLETDLLSDPVMVTLQGRFELDALSAGGDNLYLINYLPPYGSGSYQVRVYDLKAGQLLPQAVTEGLDRVKQIVPTMSGTVLQQVVSPEGKWVYSLYLNREHGPFIHALDTSSRSSYCIFLPVEHKEDLSLQAFWSLALSSDGTRLYAANGALGVVQEHDTGTRANRTGGFDSVNKNGGATGPEQQPIGNSSGRVAPTFGAALSAEDRILYVLGTRELHIVDTGSLRPVRVVSLDKAAQGMSLSRDGSALYVITRGPEPQVLVVDTSSGVTVRTLNVRATNALAVLTSL